MLRPCELSRTASNNKGIMSTSKEKDRISELPDELVYTILSDLKLRDAVKTSVLSHRWKHVYSSRSMFQFDWDNMNHELLETCKHPCVLNMAEKFVRGVNQFLQFYKGTITHISSFTVDCCLGHEWTNDIDQWVRFAVGRGVEKLSLNLYCEKYSSKHDEDKNGRRIEGKYVLQTELFQSIKSNLKHLTLAACIFGPNFTYQFSCLESLHLAFMCLVEYDLHSMFSCLLKLKVLHIFRCTLPMILCLSPLPLLKEFTVLNSAGLKKIELSNVNLLTFNCICSHIVMFDLRGAPNLIEFAYHAVSWELAYILSNFPEQLHMFRSLQIMTLFNWVEWIPDTISNFSQVTTLSLRFLKYSKFSIVDIIYILTAFPNLRSFKLSTHCPEDLNRQILNPGGGYVSKHLTEVKLSGFYGTRKQMEFAIYLLKNASSLKQMIITPEIGACRWIQNRQWYEGERQMVMEGLQEFAKDGVLIIQ